MLQPDSGRLRLVTLPPAPPPVAAAALPTPAVRAPGGAVTFGLSFAAYVLIGLALVYLFESIALDAWSRVANASYVLFSRDPHLAAIGFVWNPLPSILVMPLLPFRALWPGLVEQGFAANLASAAAMAGAVHQVRGALLDAAVRRPVRLALTAAFACHPLIVHYGANGMSEALFLLALVVTVRYLGRWLRAGDLASLVVAGIGLAIGYLTRYEAAAAAVAGAALVGWVAWRRWSGGPRERAVAALADALVFATPFAASFAAWAAASWIVVGTPFETFSSAYGNNAQLRALGGPDAAASGPLYLARQVLGIAPGLVAIGLLASAVALRRRDPTILAIVAILGSAVAFSGLAFLTGRSFGWLRFQIAAVPLLVLLAGCVLGRVHGLAGRAGSALALASPSGGRSGSPPRRLTAERLVADGRELVRLVPRPVDVPRLSAGRLAGLALAAAVVVATLAAVPAAARTMLDPVVSRGDEAHQLQSIADRSSATGAAGMSWGRGGEQIAARIDGLGLGRSSVLLDVFSGFPIVLHSARPDTFVITPDRDFQSILADPAAFGVRYALLPEPTGNSQLDAIERAHPGAWARGAGIGPLVEEFRIPGFRWRLYAVDAGRSGTPADDAGTE